MGCQARLGRRTPEGTQAGRPIDYRPSSEESRGDPLVRGTSLQEELGWTPVVVQLSVADWSVQAQHQEERRVASLLVGLHQAAHSVGSTLDVVPPSLVQLPLMERSWVAKLGIRLLRVRRPGGRWSCDRVSRAAEVPPPRARAN